MLVTMSDEALSSSVGSSASSLSSAEPREGPPGASLPATASLLDRSIHAQRSRERLGKFASRAAEEVVPALTPRHVSPPLPRYAVDGKRQAYAPTRKTQSSRLLFEKPVQLSVSARASRLLELDLEDATESLNRRFSYSPDDPVRVINPSSREDPVRVIYPVENPSSSANSLLNAYKLTRKDAKKRKEIRFTSPPSETNTVPKNVRTSSSKYPKDKAPPEWKTMQYQQQLHHSKQHRPILPTQSQPRRSSSQRSLQADNDDATILASCQYTPFDFSRFSCFPQLDSVIPLPTNSSPRGSPKTVTDHLVGASREEILKLKKELRQLRRLATLKSVERGDSKMVRFASPLVTQVTTRPKTDPADIPNLFFAEEELEELENDRETTDTDQFEVCIDSNRNISSSKEELHSSEYDDDFQVSVSYKNPSITGCWSDVSSVYE